MKKEFKPLCEVTIFRGKNWGKSNRIIMPVTSQSSSPKLIFRIKGKFNKKK